ncbi:MAG TPA: HAD-IIIA family hydrolase [Intrasporangiaceae bacterium]|nr:HAD-IIIA family hydrolase [Intrasporangiaceae bacterium]
MGDSGLIPPAEPDAPWDIVFLDRDGTLNERLPGYVDHPDRLVLLPGAAQAVARLNRAGCRVVLVTNQRGLATGALSWPQWYAVTRRMSGLLASVGAHIDHIEVCPHQVGTCQCRKPAPGLFRAALAAAPWARAERCAMVGDMPSDVTPAQKLGMRTVLLGQEAADVREAVDLLLQQDALDR